MVPLNFLGCFQSGLLISGTSKKEKEKNLKTQPSNPVKGSPGPFCFCRPHPFDKVKPDFLSFHVLY